MTKTAKANGSDLLDGIPDPPDKWYPFDFIHPTTAWCRGRAEVEKDGADTSGPDKALRVVRSLAWAVHLVGGSVHNIRPSLEAARHNRAQLVGRIGGLERQGNSYAADETRRSLESTDKNIATLTAQVEALQTWEGPDNAVLHQRLEEATRRHEELAARIDPYKKARLPFPPEWERELYEAEKAVIVAHAAFASGRARLDKLSELSAKATTAARQALAGSLANVCGRLGAEAARIIEDSDPAFLSGFPNRAPNELLALYARAERVSGIMNQLGAAHDAGLSRFLDACGEHRGTVLGKIDAGRSVAMPTSRASVGAVLDRDLPPGLRVS